MTVLRVVQDSHFVIIEVYFIDESINQSLSVFCIVDVAFAELIKEKTDFIYCWNCILGFLHKNLSFQPEYVPAYHQIPDTHSLDHP